VNNVGITTKHPAGVTETSEDDWDRLFSVNLKSAFLMSKYAIPRLAEGGGGSIVNISSVAAERGYPACAYSASKLGMNALTVDTAVAYGRLGIRANAVEPGFINTPMSERLVPDLDPAGRQARHEARMRSTPLGTEGTAWDVAHAALFFASDEARWVTGQVMAVDGGILALSPRLTG
jgi:NAD(P)-dependent dehydrogenase (short-subunit alcohol dehydrogenase family)